MVSGPDCIEDGPTTSTAWSTTDQDGATTWGWVVLYKMTPLVRKPAFLLKMEVQMSLRVAVMQLFCLWSTAMWS